MSTASDTQRPTVAVLLATHDGNAHVDEQMRSLLGQRDVDVRIIVSDDVARGRRTSRLTSYADDARVVALPPRELGSARANFLRLIADADVAGCDGIAFSDQDDVWSTTKLRTQLTQLDRHRVDAVSGDVTAVFGTRRVRIRKSQPQRRLDFVCESAGPGSTYLLRPETFALVRACVARDARTRDAAAHDWLVYAIVRAAGLAWHIDPEPLVDYRQHGSNVIGANVGVRAAVRRMTQLRTGSFRSQCATIAEIAADVASQDPADELRTLAADLRGWDRSARRRVLALVPELRRRPRERIALAAATRLGSW